VSKPVQQLAAQQVHAALGSRAQGLNAQEAAALYAALGANRLQQRQRLWWLRALTRQLTNFFSLLLDAAAVMCFIAERVQPGENMALLGWVLLGVSLLNAAFSFAQEYRAERAMEALARLLPQEVLVRRDGEERRLPAEALVPGDVILLREGDRVPADARVVQASGLLLNNAPLTGESFAQARSADADEAPITEACNLALAGCSVLRGNAEAVVFATGLRTQFGRVASLSQQIRRGASPLERETAHMVRVLTWIALGLGSVFFAYGVATGRPLWVNLVFMMGIIVANVPEGLLPTFTLSLAMGSLRMAKRNVLVKSLNAVEALGAVHVVCTDKTGTLTRNRLALARMVGAHGTPLDDDAAAAMRLLTCALAASEVETVDAHLSGDPLDVALAERFVASGGRVDAIMAARVRAFAFDTDLRRAGGVVRDDGAYRFAVKGAWESIAPLLAPQQDGAEAAVHRLASQGYRVLAVASRALAAAPAPAAAITDLEHGLSLDGLLCLEDPIRAEVPDAVARCHEAGIRVIMITGDHPDTAVAIARRTGILTDGAPGVITGDELSRLRELDLAQRLSAGTNVFARTTPEQKMKIVAALHELDLVVAVTGDGVNDAPALKAADVGIAMGQSGTDVARESAQVVLLDDNFASIVAGIEEGRTIFGNIRKFTNYVLVSNGPEIIPYLLYILFPVPLALSVIQILAIDLCTDIVPSMALGQEPPERDTMRQPPRPRHLGLLTRGLIAHSYGFLGLLEAAFSLTLFFHVLLDGGWQWGDTLAGDDPLYRSATGITLATIMLMQIGNLVGRRSTHGSGLDLGLLRNPLIVIGITLEAGLSWALLYVEPVARILGTGPVAAEVYAAAWLGVPLIFGLDYARKRMVRR
jgi:sodium/potassium-transporting ATPase subunit alpha